MIDKILASAVVAAFVLVLVISYFVKVHDYMLIVLISCATGWWAVRHESEAPLWIVVQFFTMVVSWTEIKLHRQGWHHPGFWGRVSLLLLVQIAACWLVWPAIKDYNPKLLLTCTMVEMLPLYVALELSLEPFDKRPRRQRPGKNSVPPDQG